MTTEIVLDAKRPGDSNPCHKFKKLSNESDSSQNYGGDDRIRTCEGLLTLNDLANRRFQPLSHVSKCPLGQNFILAMRQTLSSIDASYRRLPNAVLA